MQALSAEREGNVKVVEAFFKALQGSSKIRVEFDTAGRNFSLK